MLCLLLTGCNTPQTQKSRLVTEMSVQVRQEDTTLFRHYTDPQKMETILCYLRALKGYDHNCTDPEQYGGPRYRIELHYSDGSTGYVFQHADLFLSRDFSPWQAVDSRYAAFLLPIVENMKND